MRVCFNQGEQRKFLKKVLEELRCPNLRSFSQYGLGVSYSTMKNYFSECRTIPKELFEELLLLSKLDRKEFSYQELNENFGQVLGGKKSRRLSVKDRLNKENAPKDKAG